jgi:deoxyribodipyrimidine photo-lyase
MSVIFWHRRDLRIHDNAGLYKALKTGENVQPVFIFDTTILSLLPKNDQRVLFIYQEIRRLKSEYAALGSDLKVYVGNPKEIIPILVQDLNATAVFTNRD